MAHQGESICRYVSLCSQRQFLPGRRRRVCVTAGRGKATRARMASIQPPHVIIRKHTGSPEKRQFGSDGHGNLYIFTTQQLA